MLLSSGPAGAWYQWEAVAEGLREGNRVLRFDRPGLGLSPAVPTPPTLYGEAARLAALVPGSERATVVARSVAAWHAEAFARLHPLRVARLVLVDPACERGPNIAWAGGLRAWAPALGATWGATALARTLGWLAHTLRTGLADPHGVYRTGQGGRRRGGGVAGEGRDGGGPGGGQAGASGPLRACHGDQHGGASARRGWRSAWERAWSWWRARRSGAPRWWRPARSRACPG
ncbi:hypothetical protein GCM10020219_105390 [Nonomuraea dietziae]